MRLLLENRLQDLKREHEAGQRMIAELDAKRANVTQTLLRIEGAMQVLRELLEQDAVLAASPELPAGIS